MLPPKPAAGSVSFIPFALSARFCNGVQWPYTAARGEGEMVRLMRRPVYMGYSCEN